MLSLLQSVFYGDTAPLDSDTDSDTEHEAPAVFPAITRLLSHAPADIFSMLGERPVNEILPLTGITGKASTFETLTELELDSEGIVETTIPRNGDYCTFDILINRRKDRWASNISIRCLKNPFIEYIVLKINRNVLWISGDYIEIYERLFATRRHSDIAPLGIISKLLHGQGIPLVALQLTPVNIRIKFKNTEYFDKVTLCTNYTYFCEKERKRLASEKLRYPIHQNTSFKIDINKPDILMESPELEYRFHTKGKCDEIIIAIKEKNGINYYDVIDSWELLTDKGLTIIPKYPKEFNEYQLYKHCIGHIKGVMYYKFSTMREDLDGSLDLTNIDELILRLNLNMDALNAIRSNAIQLQVFINSSNEWKIQSGLSEVHWITLGPHNPNNETHL